LLRPNITWTIGTLRQHPTKPFLLPFQAPSLTIWSTQTAIRNEAGSNRREYAEKWRSATSRAKAKCENTTCIRLMIRSSPSHQWTFCIAPQPFRGDDPALRASPPIVAPPRSKMKAANQRYILLTFDDIAFLHFSPLFPLQLISSVLNSLFVQTWIVMSTV
jgi:hypothetical protein